MSREAARNTLLIQCGGYEIDLGPPDTYREARRIVVQLPDGLKQEANCIVDELAKHSGAEVYIHGDPSYGACDLQYPQLKATLDPDIIVHVGHTPYPEGIANPRLQPRGRPRVVYAPARSMLRPSTRTLEEAARLLVSRSAGRVVVVATGQHAHILEWVAGELRRLGVDAVVPKGLQPYFLDGQVIGCDYRIALAKGDAYLIVAGGIFHALGLYLATRRPLVKVDPYRDEAVDLTPLGERTLKIRLYKVSKAMDARRWGIIVGLKTGQYRPWLVEALRRRMSEAGVEYRLIAVENMSENVLRNLDNDWYQAFTVTSCPRIPIDDLQDYEKPVLTPGEAFMALEGRLEPYRFPW